ncbi:hypothetical protein CWO90_14275 [Bradyrhizobium sp. Leo121]|nr:hypothetical protein CWO90_14275 [Bradyrhizobium sp. Leo121]
MVQRRNVAGLLANVDGAGDAVGPSPRQASCARRSEQQSLGLDQLHCALFSIDNGVSFFPMSTPAFCDRDAE